MNNAVYGKAMENIRNRIDVKLVSNKKDYLKLTSKPSYMSRKIFDNDLVAKCKNNVTLMLNKPEYTGMCSLELSKVLMQEFHYDYIKNKRGNNSVLLFTDNDCLMYENKTLDVMNILAMIKKCLTLVIIQLNQNIMIIQRNQWLVK